MPTKGIAHGNLDSSSITLGSGSITISTTKIFEIANRNTVNGSGKV